MSEWYPLTSDDVGPTAKVGGEPPGRVWGSCPPLGTLWMVLRRWLMKVACAVPFIPRGSSPSTPGWFPVMCGTGRLVKKKNLDLEIWESGNLESKNTKANDNYQN